MKDEFDSSKNELKDHSWRLIGEKNKKVKNTNLRQSDKVDIYDWLNLEYELIDEDTQSSEIKEEEIYDDDDNDDDENEYSHWHGDEKTDNEGHNEYYDEYENVESEDYEDYEDYED